MRRGWAPAGQCQGVTHDDEDARDRGTIRSLRSGMPIEADGVRLVRTAGLGRDGVREVHTAQHGTLAVGMAEGRPFATGNVCRHQAAKLGRGTVADGCLECPWHRARFDVRSGRMVRGPQGRVFGFPPYSVGIRLWANTAVPLRTYAVEVEGDWIVLVED